MNAPLHPDSKDIVIRSMTPDDLPGAIALWSGAEGVSVSEGDSVAELRDYLRRNPGGSQVAYAGGALVGAVLAGTDGRRGYLYHLAVDPSLRGRGLGRELADRSLGQLRAQGLKRVLILVDRNNPSGRAFWERCGWEGMEFAQPLGIDL
jgi:ribosomal protein S18 acetylase RimI-like enzyme